MINEGVRQAYTHPDNVLRASILADPDGERRNTGDNTPAVIHYQVVPGDQVEIDVAAKGGGSEAKSKFAMLNPSDSIVDWVLKVVPTMVGTTFSTQSTIESDGLSMANFDLASEPPPFAATSIST